MAGHDRFIADMRPLLHGVLADARAAASALLSSVRSLHDADRRGARRWRSPAPTGAPLDAPFDLDADVAWVGYANDAAARARRAGAASARCARRGLLPVDRLRRQPRATERSTEVTCRRRRGVVRAGARAAARHCERDDQSLASSRRRPSFIARAPGRLDVMGGIADYSGSLVLQLPLAVRDVRWRCSGNVGRARSTSCRCRAAGEPRRFAIALDELVADALRDRATRSRRGSPSAPDDRWAAYVVGVRARVPRARDGANVERHGLRLLIESDVPEGKGVSSSAALEVAT